MNSRLAAPVLASIIGACTLFGASDAFLRFNGGNSPELAGESMKTDYSGWHEIDYFELGAENSVNIGSISERGSTGKASYRALQISKSVNNGSPALFAHLTSGRSIETAELVVASKREDDLGPSPAPFYKAELGLVMVSDIHWSGKDSDDIPKEEISFEFGNGRITYRKFDNSGAEEGTVFAYFDRVLNTSSSGSSGPSGGSGPTNSRPSLSGTASKTVVIESKGSFTFDVSDDNTAVSEITTSARSLNTSLIADSTISISGTGSNRTVNFTASDSTGRTIIRITADDGELTRTRDVTIYIVEPNAPPAIKSPKSLEVASQTQSFLRGIGIIDRNSQFDYTLILEVTSGLLEVSTSEPGGIVASDVSGNGTDRIIISAPMDAINTTLGAEFGLRFTPTERGTVTFDIFVEDNNTLESLTDSQSIALLPTLTRYELWERENFTPEERLANQSDPLSQFGSDGNLNLIEYAFNLKPKESDQVGIEEVIVQNQGLKYFEISFPVRTDDPTIFYELQRYSEADGQWKSEGFSATEIGNPDTINPEFEKVTIRIQDAIEDNPTALIRIFVSTQE